MKLRHLFTHDVRPGHLYRIPAAPDNVMLDLTWRCDRRCAFCYQPHEDRARADPPEATIIAILQRLRQLGVREVLYLGGEPTLHFAFARILDAGSALGFTQRVVTHGGHIDAALAHQVSALAVETGVSLHAANAAVHDSLAGCGGAFDQALRALDQLVRAGARAFVQFSPTRLAHGALTALERLLTARHAGALRFYDVNRLLPNRAASSAILDADGWWRLLLETGALATSGVKIRVESVPRCWVRSRAAADGTPAEITSAILASLRPCYMGIAQFALDPSGSLKLCPGGPPVGPSVLDCDPTDLWRTHPILVQRRQLSFLPKSCVDYDAQSLCDEFYSCAGGCRSVLGIPLGTRDPLTVVRPSSARKPTC